MGVKELLSLHEFTEDELEKIKPWTVAQFLTWCHYAERAGEDVHAVLARTRGGVMPGIGGALYGDTGTIGIEGWRGMFIGIEPDGYGHS